jgi:hypothetical protein
MFNYYYLPPITQPTTDDDRFFAAIELKAMLAHIVLNYDIRAETEGVRPPDLCFGLLRMPSSKGKIWIRKRQAVAEQGEKS